MTELEQKAEEYQKQLMKNGFNCGTCYGTCEYAFEKNNLGIVKINDFFDEVKKAYKDGYKQGQQELMASNEVVKRGFADNLEKENAELQKKYDELNDFEKSQCAKLLKENAELKAELEKLKVCGSCKYVCYSAHEEPCIHCANCFACADKSHNKWELAE